MGAIEPERLRLMKLAEEQDRKGLRRFWVEREG
jgi:hypothetical protein